MDKRPRQMSQAGKGGQKKDLLITLGSFHRREFFRIQL